MRYQNTDNVIPFTPVSEDKVEEAIIINHGIRTMETAKALSDYIKVLPLSNEQNNKLIGLLKDQLLIAEHESYIQGFTRCMDAIQMGSLEELMDKVVRSSEPEQ